MSESTTRIRMWRAAPFLLGLALGMLASAPAHGQAQTRITPDIGAPELVLLGGVFDYDLGRHGEGVVPIGGLRVNFPLSSYFSIAPALAYTEYTADEVDADADDRVRLTTLEFQVNAYYPLDRFRPYLGISSGGTVDFRGERGSDDFLVVTVSGVAGVAVDVGRGWSALAEIRSRGFNGIENDALEFLAGISTSF